MLVQDTEILIAALHNPAATLQYDDSLHIAMNNISENFTKTPLSTMSEDRSYVPKNCKCVIASAHLATTRGKLVRTETNDSDCGNTLLKLFC